MNDEIRSLVQAMHREAVEEWNGQPLRSTVPRTISYKELPESAPDSPLKHEWDVYRREVGRLLGEGRDGHFVLIKNESIVGVWQTKEQAEAVAIEKYLMQPVLIKQILAREPVLRGPNWFWRCPR